MPQHVQQDPFLEKVKKIDKKNLGLQNQILGPMNYQSIQHMVVGDMVDGLTLTNKRNQSSMKGVPLVSVIKTPSPKPNYEFKQLNLLEFWCILMLLVSSTLSLQEAQVLSTFSRKIIECIVLFCITKKSQALNVSKFMLFN